MESASDSRNRRLFPCPYCDLVASSGFNLRRHLSRQHVASGHSTEVDSGENSSNGVQTLSDWQRDEKPGTSSHIKKKHECKSCGMKFGTKFNLNRHFKKLHLESTMKRADKANIVFECPECSEKFSRRFNLKRHITRVHPESPEIADDDDTRKTIYCYLCKFSCCRLQQLCRHVQEEHKIPMILFEDQINDTDQFNALIASLRESFSATVIKRPSNAREFEHLVFRCNHSTSSMDLGKLQKAPCTFYFKVRRVNSTYNIFGCHSHFGHEIMETQHDGQNSIITNSNSHNNLNLDDFDALDNELGFLDSIPNEYLDSIVKIEPDSSMLPFDDNFPSQSFNPTDQLLNHIQASIKNHISDDFQQFNQIPETSNEMDAGPSGRLCKYGLSRAQMTSKITEEYVKKVSTLEKLAPNAFRSQFLRSPNGRKGNAYGGLLFAQSMQAAQATVDKRFIPHSMHCFFILNIDSTGIVDYKIQNVRDGRSFSTRYVNAEQDGKIAMSSQISFCVKEDTSIEHQLKMPNVPGPETLIDSAEFCKQTLDKYEKGEIELSQNSARYMASLIELSGDSIFEIRCTDPMRYYGIDKKRSIEPYYFWLKTRCELSGDPDEHRFLIAYITDFSLASAANRPHASLGYTPSMVLSLDHTVHFHDFNYKADQWILYENFSTWASHGRAFSQGRMWTRDGRLVLSASQESLTRTRGEKSCI